jgi:hypothetical protein
MHMRVILPASEGRPSGLELEACTRLKEEKKFFFSHCPRFEKIQYLRQYVMQLEAALIYPSVDPGSSP